MKRKTILSSPLTSNFGPRVIGIFFQKSTRSSFVAFGSCIREYNKHSCLCFSRFSQAFIKFYWRTVATLTEYYSASHFNAKVYCATFTMKNRVESYLEEYILFVSVAIVMSIFFVYSYRPPRAHKLITFQNLF